MESYSEIEIENINNRKGLIYFENSDCVAQVFKFINFFKRVK